MYRTGRLGEMLGMTPTMTDKLTATTSSLSFIFLCSGINHLQIQKQTSCKIPMLTSQE